jgi:hypothetical protein
MLSHTTRHTWRTLFWTTACISAFAAIIRAFLFIPESKVFLRAKEHERALGGSTGGKIKVFIHRVQTMLKTHWGRCVYAILLMAMPEDAERTKLRCGTGFNFLSHGSQDLYPTYLQTTKGFDSDRYAIRSSQRSSAMSAPSRVSLSLYMHIHFLFFPQWWGHCTLYFAAYRPPAHDYFVRYTKRGFHSALDYSVWLQYACSWRILCAIWRTGCLGCDPHTARRDKSTLIPRYLPRCYIPN